MSYDVCVCNTHRVNTSRCVKIPYPVGRFGLRVAVVNIDIIFVCIVGSECELDVLYSVGNDRYEN